MPDIGFEVDGRGLLLGYLLAAWVPSFIEACADDETTPVGRVRDPSPGIAEWGSIDFLIRGPYPSLFAGMRINAQSGHFGPGIVDIGRSAFAAFHIFFP